VLSRWTFEPLSGWFNAVVGSIWRPLWPEATQLQTEPNTYKTGLLVRSLYNLGRIATGAALGPLRWSQGAVGYGEELVVIARAQYSTASS